MRQFFCSLFIAACFVGSANAGDHVVIADVNADGKADTVWITKTSDGWEFQAWDLATRKIICKRTIAANRLGGWRDAGDRTLVGDVNGDGRPDLVFVNTGGTGGAVQAIDIVSGERLALIDYTDTRFNGWFDESDILKMADVNADGKDDLVLVNTGGTGGAVKAFNIGDGKRIAMFTYKE